MYTKFKKIVVQTTFNYVNPIMKHRKTNKLLKLLLKGEKEKKNSFKLENIP